jgi:phenylpropionate dioxygenase-like ring-hydroxylating dioxygenase large terminal subunit
MEEAGVFVHQTQLRHLLAPADYFSPRQHEIEQERLFLPSWQPVASTRQLRHHGDFLTRELFGKPILVRNIDGQIHTFLNVCAHRHAMLTHEPCGHDPRFRCQYHGWEYGPDGHTRRVPEAHCFRPFDRENARLRKFRTAACGELLFTCLDDAAPPLEEHLGPFHEECRKWFAPPFELAWTWDTTYEANWKVVVENSLESYHIPCLHRKTFGILPEEQTCRHDLAERWTTFHTPESFSWISRGQNFVVRSLGQPTTNIYTHHHAHPNLTFVSMDVLRMAQTVLPTSPTTARHLAWVYTLRGTRHNPWAWLARHVLAWIVVKVARQVLREDAWIFAHLQKGLQASTHPGVIGTREERIYAFHKYLLSACGRNVELDRNGDPEEH